LFHRTDCRRHRDAGTSFLHFNEGASQKGVKCVQNIAAGLGSLPEQADRYTYNYASQENKDRSKNMKEKVQEKEKAEEMMDEGRSKMRE
jgi:hypothetical protein